jgi:hypothetical protein
LAQSIAVGARLGQYLCGHALAVADQSEQHVLSADVVVAQLQRLTQAHLQRTFGVGREGDMTRRGVTPTPDGHLHRGPQLSRLYIKPLQLVHGQTTSPDDAQQEVLGPDVGVPEPARFFLREHDRLSRLMTEPLEHALRVGTSRLVPSRSASGGPRMPTPSPTAMDLDNALARTRSSSECRDRAPPQD